MTFGRPGVGKERRETSAKLSLDECVPRVLRWETSYTLATCMETHGNDNISRTYLQWKTMRLGLMNHGMSWHSADGLVCDCSMTAVLGSVHCDCPPKLLVAALRVTLGMTGQAHATPSDEDSGHASGRSFRIGLPNRLSPNAAPVQYGTLVLGERVV